MGKTSLTPKSKWVTICISITEKERREFYSKVHAGSRKEFLRRAILTELKTIKK